MSKRGRRIQRKQLHNVLKVFRKGKGSLRIKKVHDVTERRLSSEEFLRVHKKLWKEGPKVKYSNPDGWVKPESNPEDSSENRRTSPV